jgi:Domain of unknown function (DUF4390)
MSLRSGLFALLLLPLAAAAAEQADGKWLLDSAWVNVRGAVFEVNARAAYPVDERVRTTLDAGATVYFDIQALVEKKSRYWFDDTLVDVTLKRALTWNALTRRYELKELADGELRTFATLEHAVVAAGEVVNWPVIVEPQLDQDANYRIRVRAGYHRGSLPASLQALLPWSDGWNRRSEWSSWTLPR